MASLLSVASEEEHMSRAASGVGVVPPEESDMMALFCVLLLRRSVRSSGLRRGRRTVETAHGSSRRSGSLSSAVTPTPPRGGAEIGTRPAQTVRELSNLDGRELALVVFSQVTG